MVVRVLCLFYWQAFDATSAMSFFSLAVENVRRGVTCARRCCSVSACKIRPSFMDRFDVGMFAHAAVWVLSRNIPM